MKRKKMKKGISIALSAAMAAGMLSGCGGGSNSSSTASTSGESDVPTYTIATVRWTDTWPTDFLESGIMKELEEKNGIHIEWQIYYNSDWAEQKSLLLASGDLPDAFLGSISLNASDMTEEFTAFQRNFR